MNPNKALWEKGDFTKIAAFMRQSGEAVVKSIGKRRLCGLWTSAAETAPRRFHWPVWGLKLRESIFQTNLLMPEINEPRRRV